MIPIYRDRLLKQSQSLENPLFRAWKENRKRAKIEIIGGEVDRGPCSGATHLGRLQGWLDHPREPERHPVLQLENIFKRAIEAIGPQMRPGCRLDQLPGDADAAAGLAHRAFQHVSDAELASDLLHIDRLTLVTEARIAGDDEQPADA